MNYTVTLTDRELSLVASGLSLQVGEIYNDIVTCPDPTDPQNWPRLAELEKRHQEMRALFRRILGAEPDPDETNTLHIIGEH